MYIDSHAHLSDSKIRDIENLILDLKSKGISKVISIGCTQTEIEKSFELAEKYPGLIYSTAGVYPLYNSTENKGLNDIHLLQTVKDYSEKEKIVAVGECGIDLSEPPPWEEKRTQKEQEELFRSQIEIAIECNKPIIVHSRNAPNETLNILKDYHARLNFVWHCFTEELSIANRIIEINGMISLTGIITYKSAENLMKVIEKIPLERLMVETDSPYLTPDPIRKKGIKINEPQYVKIVCEKIAQIKDLSVQEVEEKTTHNAEKFFKL